METEEDTEAILFMLQEYNESFFPGVFARTAVIRDTLQTFTATAFRSTEDMKNLIEAMTHGPTDHLGKITISFMAYGSPEQDYISRYMECTQLIANNTQDELEDVDRIVGIRMNEADSEDETDTANTMPKNYNDYTIVEIIEEDDDELDELKESFQRMNMPTNNATNQDSPMEETPLHNAPPEEIRYTSSNPSFPNTNNFDTIERPQVIEEIMRIQESARVNEVTKDLVIVNSVWSDQCLPCIGDWIKEVKRRSDSGPCAYFYTKKVGQNNSKKFVAIGKGRNAGHIEMNINMNQEWEIKGIEKIRYAGKMYFSATTMIPEWHEEVHINLMCVDDRVNPSIWSRWTSLTRTTPANKAKRTMAKACQSGISGTPIKTPDSTTPAPKRMPIGPKTKANRSLLASLHESELLNKTGIPHENAHSFLAKFPSVTTTNQNKHSTCKG